MNKIKSLLKAMLDENKTSEQICRKITAILKANLDELTASRDDVSERRLAAKAAGSEYKQWAFELNGELEVLNDDIESVKIVIKTYEEQANIN